MTRISNMQLPPPAHWQAFEDLCCDFFSALWGDSFTQKNGRSGQSQYGIDIFGNYNQELQGVQCKGKESFYSQSVTIKELHEEVKKALSFKPNIRNFILVTTGRKDAVIEQEARLITEQHKAINKFTVSVWGWEDIILKLEVYEHIIEKHYPTLYRNNSLSEVQKALILDQNPTNLEVINVGFLDWLSESEKCFSVTLRNISQRTAKNIAISVLLQNSEDSNSGLVNLTPLNFKMPTSLAIAGGKNLILPLCLYSDISCCIDKLVPSNELLSVGIDANIPSELMDVIHNKLSFESSKAISIRSIPFGINIIWDDIFNQKVSLLTPFWAYVVIND